MPYALELALDDAAAGVVRELWRDIAAAGFPFMAESGANPHVSLAIWNEIDRDAMAAALTRFAATTPAIDIVFPTVGTFASTGVVFLAPALNARLVEVHRRCHETFVGLGGGPWPHYAPGAWAPHCTLAQDVGPTLDRIASLARHAALPLRGRPGAGRARGVPPVRRLTFAPLAGA